MTDAPSSLSFMMGNFKAVIPADRGYSSNHLWIQRFGEDFRVGLTAYSVRLLQDVYFLEWNVDPNTPVKLKQEIGEVESSKALSSLYAPFDGTVLEFNQSLLDDPSGINVDNYGSGWLYSFRTEAESMNAEEYIAHLEAGWEKTQNMIKGQMN